VARKVSAQKQVIAALRAPVLIAVTAAFVAPHIRLWSKAHAAIIAAVMVGQALITVALPRIRVSVALRARLTSKLDIVVDHAQSPQSCLLLRLR
jgi:hypothetical protein